MPELCNSKFFILTSLLPGLLLSACLAFADPGELARVAEQGHAIAQYYLGYMFSTGDGLPRDDAEAIHWFRLAAERGHTSAQERLREYQDTNNPDR